MNNHLAHRVSQTIASLEKASTPGEIADARRAGLSIKAELERNQTDDAALALIKLAQANPRNVLKALSDTSVVRDHPVFMVQAKGSAGHGTVELADGTKVVATQGIIPVPSNMVAAMVARGWKRMNDAAITSLNTTMQDPPRPDLPKR
jgi:hypothetical protein